MKLAPLVAPPLFRRQPQPEGLLTTDPHTPIFNSVLAELPVSSPNPLVLTKRQRHKAGRLTEKVWAALSRDINADTSALTVTTQELPEVQ